MAAAATSFQQNWLNRWYMKLDRVHAASIKGSPWLKRVRFENTGGEVVAQPFTLYGHRGDSGDLATAQTLSGDEKNSIKKRWLVPYGTYEGSVRIPHRDIALSRKDKDASARALQFDTDLALKQRGANIVRLWFANPGYSLVTATRAHAAGVITLGNALEVSNFIPGDRVVPSANDGNTSTDVLTPGAADGFVVSRDFVALTVSVSTTKGGAVGAPAGWPATAFYFRKGEFLPASGGAIDMITPLQAYLPPSVLTTTLHGVTRAEDSILCGFRVATASTAGKSICARIERVINEHREQMGYQAEDSEIDCAYMNPLTWGKAAEEIRTQLGRPPEIKISGGVRGIEWETANGPIMFVSEPQCPRDVIFLLAQGDIVWHTPTGTIAEMVDQDGSIVSRMANSNDLELRPVSYIAAKMSAPFKHARLSAA